MEDFDTRILVDAKEEYSKELTRVLKRYILEGIESLYSQACEICKKNKSKTIITFQDLLEQIPKWNQELIEKETNRIIESSKCEFFEDLITAVFISHTKILAAIRTNKKNKRINLTIPKSETFIHKCYIEAAREFWKSPCMFDKRVNNFEQQRNNKYCEEVISHCIQETIRKLLPLKYILKESLGDSVEEDASFDNEDITKSISKSEESNLRMLVKNEIQNHYSNNSLSQEENIDLILSDDFNKEPSENINKKENKDTETKDASDNKDSQDSLKTEKDSKNTDTLEISKSLADLPLEIKSEKTLEADNIKSKEKDISQQEDNTPKEENINSVKDIKIQTGGNSLFTSSNNINTNVSKVESLNDNNKSINIDTFSSFKNDLPESVPMDTTLNKKTDDSLNLDSIQISDISSDLGASHNLNNTKISSNTNTTTESGGDLNELDIGSLVKNDSVVNLDGDFNMVDTNNLYNNLNKDTTIKSDVMSNFNNNLRNESTPNLFDDAPLTD